MPSKAQAATAAKDNVMAQQGLTPKQLMAAAKKAVKAESTARAKEKSAKATAVAAEKKVALKTKAAEKAAATKAKNKETARAKAEVSSKAKDTAALLELKPMAIYINARLKSASRDLEKSDDHRLEAAAKCSEARDYCKANKLPFEKWVLANITDRSYVEVRKLAAVGSSDDPRAAIAELRQAGAKRQKALRDRTAEVKNASGAPKNTATDASSKPPTAFEQADAAMGALGDKGAVNLATSILGHNGLVAMPKAEAEKLRKNGHVDQPGTNLEDHFNALSATRKMAFLTWAANEVGAKIDMGMAGNGEDKGADNLDIPEALRRNKKSR